MDDIAIGRLFRELRVRLGWPQATVALKARISRSSYSDIECGRLESVPLRKLRRVAAVLEVRLQLEPRWRGAAVDRIVSSRHAVMAERVTRILIDAGWEVRPEVSFNYYGERGIVDLLAWHAPTATLLIVELKTELVDTNELLGVMDRRRRLAARISDPFGWPPGTIAQWVVVAESRTNRRRLAAVQSVVRAAFPSDGRVIPRWIAQPSGPLHALSFLTDSRPAGNSQRCAPRLRVRRPTASVAARRPAA